MAIHLFARPGPSPEPHRMQRLVSLFQAGHLQEAESMAQTLADQFPQHALAWTMLGAIYRAQQRHEQAIPMLRKVVELTPSDAKSHFNLANALRDLCQYQAAMESYQRALKLQKDLPNGYFHLGSMQHELGLLAWAESSYRKALAQTPAHVPTLSNLAHLLQDMGRLDEALPPLQQALELEPSNALLHYNLADLLHDWGRFEQALAACDQALALQPDMAQAHSQKGSILQEMGRLEEAVACQRMALQLAPDDLATRSRLLFTLNYLPQPDRAACRQEALDYGQWAQQAAGETPALGALPPEPTPLRVGWLSADLRSHPVGHFLEAVLGQLKTERLELVAISTQTHEDDLTQRIKPYFSAWHSVAGLDDAAAAALIHNLGLHVLLDLSGHTAGNRLPLLALRLAPVQASWLGYFATTGVTEMDYLVADAITLPPALEADFTETIWRLPETRLCFTAPAEPIAVNALPALDHGALTFGCFSNLSKVNDAVVALWSRVLLAVPDSRLRIQSKPLRDDAMQAALVARFAQHGISGDRLVLQGPVSRQQYLAAYHQVDIVLDTFPYPGGTTTVESLWMGVPVLTLAGQSFLSRQGMGLLANAGLADWVVSQADDYVACAQRWAHDLPALARLRHSLRQQVLASPVFDAKRFAQHFEAALWGMWHERKAE